jgi:quinol monooxygenase YgiN
MLIVTGSVLARADSIERALALSIEHVKRSRAEPGCLSHSVRRDAENPLRLVFVEEWADRDALEAHFAVPASREFAKAIGALAAAPPNLKIYSAEPIRIPFGAAPSARGE